MPYLMPYFKQDARHLKIVLHLLVTKMEDVVSILSIIPTSDAKIILYYILFYYIIETLYFNSNRMR